MLGDKDTTAVLDTLEGVALEPLMDLLQSGSVVRVFQNSLGKPYKASALIIIDASAESVWQRVWDLDSLPAFIEMVESFQTLKSHDDKELVRVNLRFKIAFFSARFHFVARVRRLSQRYLELSYHSGKVRDVLIRFEVKGLQDGRSVLLCLVAFDPNSLGWLVNVFIKHHPEIEWGIHAGSAMSIADAVRTMVQQTRARVELECLCSSLGRIVCRNDRFDTHGIG